MYVQWVVHPCFCLLFNVVTCNLLSFVSSIFVFRTPCPKQIRQMTKNHIVVASCKFYCFLKFTNFKSNLSHNFLSNVYPSFLKAKNLHLFWTGIAQICFWSINLEMTFSLPPLDKLQTSYLKLMYIATLCIQKFNKLFCFSAKIRVLQVALVICRLWSLGIGDFDYPRTTK